MSTLGKKEVRINVKINPILREEFQAAASLRGASMSSLLHQHVVKIVREEKERDPEAFAEALSFVRSGALSDPEGNAVYGGINFEDSTALTEDLTVIDKGERPREMDMNAEGRTDQKTQRDSAVPKHEEPTLARVASPLHPPGWETQPGPGREGEPPAFSAAKKDKKSQPSKKSRRA